MTLLDKNRFMYSELDEKAAVRDGWVIGHQQFSHWHSARGSGRDRTVLWVWGLCQEMQRHDWAVRVSASRVPKQQELTSGSECLFGSE